jgi:hypothetical protein
MTLEFITALSNVATLVILLGGSIAAFVQLRHVRTGNELQAVLEAERRFAEPELQSALLYVQDALPAKLAQPAYRTELAARGYVDPRAHPEMAVCNWFNDMGAMVAGGVLNEEVFFDSFGRLVEYYWRLLSPTIALLRRERGVGQYASFEFLAFRAQRWRERNRGGSYPAGLPRMLVLDPWAHTDGASGRTG